MAFTSRNTMLQKRAERGISMPLVPVATASGTAAAQNSGGVNVSITANNIGSTLPSTVQSFLLPAGLPNELFGNCLTGTASSVNSRVVWLSYFYLMGTVDLANAAATPYNGFTHSAGWSGTLQRTIMGATTDILLIPTILITTGTATTAPVFELNTVAGGAGYVDESGNNVIGNVAFTCPAAATASGSMFVLRLNDGDSAIKNMTQMKVTTKGTAGAANVYGVEPLIPCFIDNSYGGAGDAVFGGLRMHDLKPAVPSSGTVTSRLGLFAIGSNSATTYNLMLEATLNA